ncbi:MAG TPA: cation diffusion facilitator family transporter [Geminicoccaceae bacterium]|nr:cation diffusion facilitator family transporter [Geminicoccaceae bacterium]
MLPSDPKRLNHRAALASIAVALTLIAAKLGAWLVTDSIVILTALVDSGIDLLASLVTLISVRQAAQPADRAHRYGHGKAEALAAFAQAGFVGGSALILASEAIQRLISPQAISQGRLGIAVMLLAIALTAGLVLFQRAVVRRTGSVAIRADSLHYRADLLMNLAVIGSLVLSEALGSTLVDPLVALAIVAWLLYGAVQVARHALDMLMDRELPSERRQHIRALALAHPAAQGMHDLRTRRAGADVFIELHLELDGALSLDRAHDITHEVEARIRESFPEADIIVHQEPAGLADERLDHKIAAVER